MLRGQVHSQSQIYLVERFKPDFLRNYESSVVGLLLATVSRRPILNLTGPDLIMTIIMQCRSDLN